DVIENIDIGGPTMLRAAAKNGKDVIVAVDPDDYDGIIEAVKNGSVDVEMRKKLSAKVIRHTAQYDARIARYFNQATEETFPNEETITFEKVQELRYGENPHQRAAFYKDELDQGLSLANAKQHHGKSMSYNNIQDATAALAIVTEYEEASTVAVTHMNPCRIGVADGFTRAFRRAYEAEPVSSFGGVIAVNREVEAATA